MKNLHIKIENQENANQSLQVTLTGRLNEMNAIDFKENLMEILKDRNTDCSINIQQLSALDVIGINALAMAHRQIEKGGNTLSIVSQDETPVYRAFQLTKFDRILNVVRA